MTEVWRFPIRWTMCENLPLQQNLYMLPGHIGLAEYETTLGIAQELSGSLVTLQNLPGSLHKLFQLTADKYNIDYILVDMSRSLGPINQNIICTRDYFLVPMTPDYFSVMAIESLASVLPKWKKWANTAQETKVLKEAIYPLPDSSPKFLGTIIQKYRLRSGTTASAAFQRWIDEIQNKLAAVLIPALRDNGMMMPDEVYADAGIPLPEPIIQMSEFNGLIAQSQKYSVPVFALTDEQLELKGIVLGCTKKSMELFRQLFSLCADRIISITTHG